MSLANAMSQTARDNALFVDLDGTLIATDLLWETLLGAVRLDPLVLLKVPGWLAAGRWRLKAELAARAEIRPENLPYRADVLAFVTAARAAGRPTILATASHEHLANAVAEHLGVFDAVLATREGVNLKSARKLAAIEAHCTEIGATRWGYIGDSTADLAVWAKADEILAVGSVARKVDGRTPTQEFVTQGGRLRAIIKAIRPHQWAKNVLLLLPLGLSHMTDAARVVAVLFAFVAFSLCASSVYVLNDMLDVEADRAHPRKKKRPFAAGTLPLAAGPGLAVALLTGGLGLAAFTLPGSFFAVLLLYLVSTTLYSTVLKKMALVDVFLLAGLYTLRIYAGGVAAGLPVSEWLLAFSIFIFTSLAFAKRFVEIDRVGREGKQSAEGRGYLASDLPLLESLGSSSGYLAAVVFALYISNGLPGFYTRQWALWLVCPLLLFWISRLWLFARRGELHDDPVVFALTDKGSLVIGALAGFLVVVAGW